MAKAKQQGAIEKAGENKAPACFDGSLAATRKVFAKAQSELGGRTLSQQLEMVLVCAMRGMEERAREQALSFTDMQVLRMVHQYAMGAPADEDTSKAETNYVSIMLNVQNNAQAKETRKFVENKLLEAEKVDAE